MLAVSVVINTGNIYIFIIARIYPRLLNVVQRRFQPLRFCPSAAMYYSFTYVT